MSRRTAKLLAVLFLVVFAASCSSNKPVASVNGEKITRQDLDMETFIRMGPNGAGSNDADKQALRSQVLRGLILETLAVQEAKSRGLTVSADEIDSQMPGMDQGPGKEALKKQLKNMHLDMKTYRKEIGDRILVGKLAAVLVPAAAVSNADAMNVYKSQPKALLAIYLKEKPGSDMSFDKVKNRIKTMILQQKREQAIVDLIKSRRATAKVKILN